MIIWSGRGFLIPLVLIVCFFIFAKTLPDGYANTAFVATFWITAAFSWFVGKKWNDAEGKTMIDKASGQEVVLKPNHALFFIKMQYWGIILGILGLVMLITSF